MTKNNSLQPDQEKPNQDTEDCHQSLAAVGKRYRGELPATLLHMERLLPDIAGGDVAALDEMIGEAHKLSGSAQIFGIPKLSAAMVDVESLLSSVSADLSHFRDSAAWLRVDKALCLAKSAVYDEADVTDERDG